MRAFFLVVSGWFMEGDGAGDGSECRVILKACKMCLAASDQRDDAIFCQIGNPVGGPLRRLLLHFPIQDQVEDARGVG